MQLDHLFEAKAENLSGTMGSHAGMAGFKIPEYQRAYDWKTENIRRLLEDCLSGYYNCWRADSSYTFLGTIIVVEERNPERTFDGTSLIVVDGQQRLTTLVLACCALIEGLLEHEDAAAMLPEWVREWLADEIQFQLEALFACVVGKLPARGTNYPFPRIIRETDARGANPRDSEYRSVVAKFVQDFTKFFQGGDSRFVPSKSNGGAEERRLRSNYEFVKCQLFYAMKEEPFDNDDFELEYERDSVGHFDSRGVRRLFVKLQSLAGEPDRNKAVASIANADIRLKDLVRFVTFSSYITQCLVITRVETEDDRYAFDMFDALNTTGEPLTAIETFRPLVIRFEEGREGYRNSESETHLATLREFIDDVYGDTEPRQKETKELVVSFSLYVDGEKLGLKLTEQRNYLRNRFERLASRDRKGGLRRAFVRSIADMAEFRYRYWNGSQIGNLDSLHSIDYSERVKLCFDFIRAMNMSIALPLLARYWVLYRRDVIDESSFVSATEAVTAFIVLRRAITGGTGGIDTDFRQLMESKPKVGGDSICTGVEEQHELISVGKLREELRERYLRKVVQPLTRDRWVELASGVGLGGHSRPLCRFVLLAASHNARPDEATPGLIKRTGVIPSEELSYLTYRTWVSQLYATVEHVAPESNSAGGWDQEIYRDLVVVHTIGNLVLLPQRENSAISNVPWPRKNVFYTALAARTVDERAAALEEAGKSGFSFGKKTEGLIKRGERLRMLDSVVEVETWDRDFIRLRTQRILELSWDVVSRWLGPFEDELNAG